MESMEEEICSRWPHTGSKGPSQATSTEGCENGAAGKWYQPSAWTWPGVGERERETQGTSPASVDTFFEDGKDIGGNPMTHMKSTSPSVCFYPVYMLSSPPLPLPLSISLPTSSIYLYIIITSCYELHSPLVLNKKKLQSQKGMFKGGRFPLLRSLV